MIARSTSRAPARSAWPPTSSPAPPACAPASKPKACSELLRAPRFVSPMRQRWPARLWLVRHGQSAGNVARDAATAAGKAVIDLQVRDVDGPLSPLGDAQAAALGRWFAALPEDERPEVVLASPYVRAQQTAAAICEGGGVAAATQGPVKDERLREREFGLWDRLTTAGVREKFPEQAEQRSLLG